MNHKLYSHRDIRMENMVVAVIMRSNLSLVLMIGVVCAAGAGTTVQAQGTASHAVRERAETYVVHISPTTVGAGSSSIQIGADRWSARGGDLKTLIAEVYDVDARQVYLSKTVDGAARYDVSLTLANDAYPETTQRMLRTAIEERFHLAITPESRSMKVYLLTAPNGLGPAMHRHEAAVHGNWLFRQASLESETANNDAQQISFTGKKCSGVASEGISATAASLAEFSRTLEPDLDRLLVDDTKLAGSFDFRVGTYRNQQELFQRLRDELGLVIVPAQRQMSVLTVRPI